MIIARMTQPPTPASTPPMMPNLPPSGQTTLHDWGVIRAAGLDAAVFLQGQLTQDVQALDDGRACWAGYCSAKGRLLATFLVWRPAPDEFLLACRSDVLHTTLKRLSMYVMRAKCKLSDASEQVPLVGCWGASAATPALAPGQVRDGCIGLTPVQGLARSIIMRVTHASDDEPEKRSVWAWMEVASGVPQVVGSTGDAFVPQMINWELVGGVSFKKGCFPGQEVVARSQYRGTLKRRMQLFSSGAPMVAGQEVFHASDALQPAGTVVNAASYQGNHLALVSLKSAVLDATGSTRLALVRADGATMMQQPMAYDVPLEAAD